MGTHELTGSGRGSIATLPQPGQFHGPASSPSTAIDARPTWTRTRRTLRFVRSNALLDHCDTDGGCRTRRRRSEIGAPRYRETLRETQLSAGLSRSRIRDIWEVPPQNCGTPMNTSELIDLLVEYPGYATSTLDPEARIDDEAWRHLEAIAEGRRRRLNPPRRRRKTFPKKPVRRKPRPQRPARPTQLELPFPHAEGGQP